LLDNAHSRERWGYMAGKKEEQRSAPKLRNEKVKRRQKTAEVPDRWLWKAGLGVDDKVALAGVFRIITEDKAVEFT
jgi:hypothetical protein